MRDRAVLSGARALNTPVRDNALHYIIVIKYTRAARGQVDWLQADTHTRTDTQTNRSRVESCFFRCVSDCLVTIIPAQHIDLFRQELFPLFWG